MMFILSHPRKNEPRKRTKGQALWKPALLRNAPFGALGRVSLHIKICVSKFFVSGQSFFSICFSLRPLGALLMRASKV